MLRVRAVLEKSAHPAAQEPIEMPNACDWWFVILLHNLLNNLLISLKLYNLIHDVPHAHPTSCSRLGAGRSTGRARFSL